MQLEMQLETQLEMQLRDCDDCAVEDTRAVWPE